MPPSMISSPSVISLLHLQETKLKRCLNNISNKGENQTRKRTRVSLNFVHINALIMGESAVFF